MADDRDFTKATLTKVSNKSQATLRRAEMRWQGLACQPESSEPLDRAPKETMSTRSKAKEKSNANINHIPMTLVTRNDTRSDKAEQELVKDEE